VLAEVVGVVDFVAGEVVDPVVVVTGGLQYMAQAVKLWLPLPSTHMGFSGSVLSQRNVFWTVQVELH
jgi:hypothetical protein